MFEPFPENSKHKFEIRIFLAQTSNEEFMKSHEESLQVCNYLSNLSMIIDHWIIIYPCLTVFDYSIGWLSISSESITKKSTLLIIRFIESIRCPYTKILRANAVRISSTGFSATHPWFSKNSPSLTQELAKCSLQDTELSTSNTSSTERSCASVSSTFSRRKFAFETHLIIHLIIATSCYWQKSLYIHYSWHSLECCSKLQVDQSDFL